MHDRRTSGDDQAPQEQAIEARLAWAVMILTLAIGSVLMVAR
jgi:hypothetical protein